MTWRLLSDRVAPLVLAAAMSACRSKEGHAQQTQTRPAMKVPAFRADVLPVLLQNCANAEGCHGNKPTDSVDLDLRAAAAFSQLDALDQYDPGVTKTEVVTPSQEGPGAARRCDLTPGGWFKEKVVDWKPNESLSFELFECSLCRSAD